MLRSMTDDGEEEDAIGWCGRNAAFDLIPFHRKSVEAFSLFSGSTLSFPPGANKSLASSIPPHQRDSSAISCATGITCTISQVIKKRSVKQLR